MNGNKKVKIWDGKYSTGKNELHELQLANKRQYRAHL